MSKDTEALRELAIEVSKHFLIFRTEEYLEPIKALAGSVRPCAECFTAAAEGLYSVISAASLPVRLTQDTVFQRKFDRFHASQSILALIPEEPGSGLSEEGERLALEAADNEMKDFLSSEEGSRYVRDQLILELDRRLKSEDIQIAAQELLVQSLISTWSNFESFARSFAIEWLNQDPGRAMSLLETPDLKDFFGKKGVDLRTIGDHGFDLSGSMGTILFKDRRLDSLANIRGTMKALFNAPSVQEALGGRLWLLNQQRHLFVHKRGVVDEAYLAAYPDASPLGERIHLTWDEVKQHLWAVQSAILAIGEAAREATSSASRAP